MLAAYNGEQSTPEHWNSNSWLPAASKGCGLLLLTVSYLSRVLYNKADNPASELAAGRVTFERVYMVPPPIERITYKDVLDISLLNQFN